MMNSLPAGFYLPVYVTEDFEKKLFFLSSRHEDCIKKAFAQFDKLKELSPLYKVNTFMTSKDRNLNSEYLGEIRPLVSTPREEKHFANQDSYDQWLADKVILKTERFFPGRPVWNIASTRHALLSSFQFKGIGFTGITGRCDFPHINGSLDIYLALYETIMSWHFSHSPIGAQKVVALWKDDHKTNPKILMLREANSFRLAQIMGIDLDEAEREVIFRSLGITAQLELRDKFQSVLKKYAWFIAYSYEYASPTFDNLMLDGSLIDCSSILHYNRKGWNIPLHFEQAPDESWILHFSLQGEILTMVTYTLKAYQNLGLSFELDTALDFFWDELTQITGNAPKVRSFFDNLKERKKQSLEEWESLLASSFTEAQIALYPREQSRFYHGPVEDNQVTYIVTFPDDPSLDYSPYEVTDRILQFLNFNRDVSPIEFAEAVLRNTRP